MKTICCDTNLILREQFPPKLSLRFFFKYILCTLRLKDIILNDLVISSR